MAKSKLVLLLICSEVNKYFLISFLPPIIENNFFIYAKLPFFHGRFLTDDCYKQTNYHWRQGTQKQGSAVKIVNIHFEDTTFQE